MRLLLPLFWTSSDVSSGFQSQGRQPYLRLVEEYVLHVPWDSPLVWHLSNLSVASMTGKPSLLLHTCEALVGLENRSYHAATHSVRSGSPDALPTELSLLGLCYLSLLMSATNILKGLLTPGDCYSDIAHVNIHTVHKRSCGKVMFLHLSVSHSAHRGGCFSACWDTPPVHTLGRQPRTDTSPKYMLRWTWLLLQ